MNAAELPAPLLANQVALVTGGNSGIGRAIAMAMAHAGADVAINHITDPSAAADIVRDIQALGRRGVAVAGSVDQESAVAEMFQRAHDVLGPVDIAVCNAGIQRDACLLDMTVEQWNAVIDVNLRGQFLCIRQAARAFVKYPKGSGPAGKILCINSIHGQQPWAGHANYAASKAGAAMLVRTAAVELARHRIRVNMISPGAIRTPINAHCWQDKAAYDALCRLVPYGRIGEPAEIGAAAVWLCSDAAGYVTGADLVVDGGLMAGLPGAGDRDAG
jgi:glucose 1-dehydrogenase